MRCSCLAAVSLALIVFLSGCSSSGISSTASYNPGYGPFDKNGNYVEAWADKPAKKHWWSRQPSAPRTPKPQKDPPRLASNTPRVTPPLPTRRSPSPSALASVSRPAAVSRPPAPRPRPSVSTYTPPKPRPIASTTPKPRPRPTPTPRPAPVKVKPKSISHTVAKGDTLYSLSRRYGTSVSSIQRANGVSGTTIRLGQRLKIPR